MASKVKIQPQNALTWVVITLVMFAFGYARIFGRVTTLAVSLFVGLVYSRKNILVMTPILLLAMVVSAPCWQTVVVSLSTAVVFFVAYCVHRKMRKRLKPVHAVIYTAISQIPLFFVYGLSLQNALWAFVDIATSSLFAICCMVGCYLFFIKGLKYKLISIEKISLCVMLLVFSLGVYRLQFNGVYWVACFLFGFFAPFVAFFYAERGFVLIATIGLAGALLDGNIVLSLFCLVSGFVVLFVKSYRRVNFLVLPALDLIFGFAIKIIPNYSFINAILLFAGGVAFAVLPNKVINAYLSTIGAERGYAVRTLVNRNRFDIYKRLNRISLVLKDMGEVLRDDDEFLKEPAENKNYLASELAFAVCGDCAKRNECERMLSAPTTAVCVDLIENVLKAGRVSILEMPPFLSEFCVRNAKMLTGCKEMLDNYSARKELTDSVVACKTLMCEQISGLSGMIDGFSKEIKQTVSFDSTTEKELIENLSAVNVIASEAVIYGTNELKNLVITVREIDESKPALSKTINKCLGAMIKSDRTESVGSVTLTYVSAPAFDVMSGVATQSKSPKAVSGDTHTVVRLSPDKVMFAICDGMGSGIGANQISDKAISLVESFYKAGIDENIVLSLINKLLSIRNKDNFSALDMCVVNLRNGTCDFIKLGGVESVIFHRDSAEVVEGGALPIGILETIKPKVSRLKLNNGDMIVMYSDGITDSIGTDGVIRICEQQKTNNPDRLAAEILDDSDFVGHPDDKTVLCIKLFTRV